MSIGKHRSCGKNNRLTEEIPYNNAGQKIEEHRCVSCRYLKTGMKNAKSAVRCFQLVMSKGPAMETKLLGAQLMALKGVLVYTSVCLKNYK